MEQEEIEKVILERVKQQHQRSGGANGLNTFGMDKELNITREQLWEAVNSLIKEKKICQNREVDPQNQI